MTGFLAMRTWRRQLAVLGVMLVASGSLASGCISRADAPFTRQTDRGDGGGGTSGLLIDSGVADTSVELPPTQPHAVLGVDPPHGSFAGGSLALVRGNGFTSDARVWFGEVEVDKYLPIDPRRIQVTVPPGHAGAVDVTVQNGDDTSTSAVLSGGYSYDQFYANPATGPTSGGTIITLEGDGTSWADDTQVVIDQSPCVVTKVTNPHELICTTPPGTQGTKAIRVTTSDQVEVDVLDAFTYGNSDNGFKGGLSGDTLSDSLRVLALDNISGLALPGATVIVGDALANADELQTDDNGVAVDSKEDLGPTQTVTIARKCYQPQTFVDVPVDTVTVFLDPILSPACGSSGQLPPSGGSGVYAAVVNGQIVWPATAEFKRAGWLDVPNPKSTDEKLVAYVFRLSSSPTARFQLPDISNAITPSSSGDRGYSFSNVGLAGNFTLYALAGIENLTPPATFTAYQMGLVRGVSAEAAQTTNDVFIPIDQDLDHALTLDLTAPTVTERGPDRVQASAAIQVGSEGYAPLPAGYISRLLPLSGPLSFVGVPPLVGSLLGTQYIATARAVTGEAGGSPLSVVGLVAATSTSDPLQIAKFVEVPALAAPAPNKVWDGVSLASSRVAGGADVDVVVYDIESAGGLIAWKIVTPGTTQAFTVPKLNALSTDLGLAHGPITITVSAAHVSDVTYRTLTYRSLSARGWTAYAQDVFYASY
jgi:IPT/TIG domain